MSDPTVAAGVTRALLDLAVSKGACRDALMARSGIEPCDLVDQDDRIPFAKYMTLMRAGKELANDPALALHFGETVDMSDISILGLIGPACETMSEAFAQLNRYARLVIEVDVGVGDRFQLAPGAGGLWIIDTRLNPNDFYELTESTFARSACGLRRMMSPTAGGTGTPVVIEVHVTHADPGYRGEYDRIFAAPVHFESDRNALLIDKAVIDHKLAGPRYVFGILSERAEALLKALESSRSTRARVESLLIPILHTGHANIDVIAGKVGMSRHALFRRLKAEGVTFEKVLDELRRKMAMHYLNGKRVSVNQTAYLVGFSEPAAFSRAFKRWTGTSPRAMRSTKVQRK